MLELSSGKRIDGNAGGGGVAGEGRVANVGRSRKNLDGEVRRKLRLC